MLVPLVPAVSGADTISDKRAEAARIAAELDQLGRQQGVYAEQYNAAVGQLDELKSKAASAKQRADVANAEISRRRQQVARYAVSSYVKGGSGGVLPLLLKSNGADMGQRQGYTSAIIGDRQTLVNALNSAKDDADHEAQALRDAAAKADAARAAVEAKRKTADEAVAKMRALNQKVTGELATLVQQEQQRRAAAEQRAAEERALRQAAANNQPAPPAAPANPTARPNPAPTPAPGRPTTPGTTTPGPSAPPQGPPVSGSVRARIVAAAESQVGVPYVYGGESPGRGFDCSGLMQWAYAQAGVSISRVATTQLHGSRRIALAQLQPGDLVFYDGNDSFMGHVAMYVGNGQIVQALHSGAPVMYSSLYFWDAIAGAGTYF